VSAGSSHIFLCCFLGLPGEFDGVPPMRPSSARRTRALASAAERVIVSARLQKSTKANASGLQGMSRLVLATNIDGPTT
jgi:hypothetical protein